MSVYYSGIIYNEKIQNIFLGNCKGAKISYLAIPFSFFRRKAGEKLGMTIDDLQIIKLNIDDLTPYVKNAKKHPKSQVKHIANSIETFGMCDPIGIWGENNVIVEGHGRVEACKMLGMSEVPCIRLDHLTDEQRRAYVHAHNKTAESEWDFDILDEEFEDLSGFDFEDFGFEFEEAETEAATTEKKPNQRLRTDENYNLPYVDLNRTEGKFQMPMIEAEDHIPSALIGFNYALTNKESDKGIHFYVDDYQFERIWNNPYKYIEVLGEYDCVLTPDFSLYMDMPLSMKIWNVFRSRLIGQMMQDAGLIVIPTVSWAESATFDFCFDGLPEGGVLSISTIGVKQDKQAFEIWKAGTTELLKRKKPSVLLVYGGEVDFDYGDTKVLYFANQVTERMKNGK